MYGVPHFVKEMDSIKKPYLNGEEVIINGDHLSLFVISEEGYKNLIKINLENQLGDLTLSFLNEHKDGLIAILETVRGTFKEKFDDNITSEFKKYLLIITGSRMCTDHGTGWDPGESCWTRHSHLVAG